MQVRRFGAVGAVDAGVAEGADAKCGHCMR